MPRGVACMVHFPTQTNITQLKAGVDESACECYAEHAMKDERLSQAASYFISKILIIIFWLLPGELRRLTSILS